jgi:hypothetical protein
MGIKTSDAQCTRGIKEGKGNIGTFALYNW